MTNEEQKKIVTPACFCFASVLLSALLVYDAAQIESGQLHSTIRYTSGRNAALGAAVRGLAEMLGLAGSIAFAALLVIATATWVTVRYRSIVRERRLEQGALSGSTRASAR